MRSELHAVVEDAYEIFGEYRVRHSLSVCPVSYTHLTLPTTPYV